MANKTINKAKLYARAKEVIANHNLFFIEDVAAFIPCSKETLYTKFPIGCKEMTTIKTMLEENKVKTKTAIRKNLFKMDNPTAQIAFYKMICTPEERVALGNKTDVTSGGKELSREPLVVEIINSANQVNTENDE